MLPIPRTVAQVRLDLFRMLCVTRIVAGRKMCLIKLWRPVHHARYTGRLKVSLEEAILPRTHGARLKE
jgi:hypothetical protein